MGKYLISREFGYIHFHLMKTETTGAGRNQLEIDMFVLAIVTNA